MLLFLTLFFKIIVVHQMRPSFVMSLYFLRSLCTIIHQYNYVQCNNWCFRLNQLLLLLLLLLFRHYYTKEMFLNYIQFYILVLVY